MKKIIIILFFGLFAQTIFGQIDKEKAIKPRHELKIADLLYAQGVYYSAAEYYKEVVRSKPDNRYAKYWLAMSTLKAADYENAVKFFEAFEKQGPKGKKTKRFEKENKEMYALSNFYYGQSLKHTENYEEAIKHLNRFKADYTLEDKDTWTKLANAEIEGAQWAIDNPNKNKQKIKSLGENVNTGYEDVGVTPVSDSVIYYTSLQEDDLIFIKNQKDIPNYRLYQSTKVNGVWEKGKKLPAYLQDEKFGTTNSAISEDGNRLYFCKCFNNEIDEVICNLYLSEKKNNKWQEAVKLNDQINSPKYTSTQPTVRTSGDGWEIVYYVSDREGGKGGMDIWYFIRTAKGDFKGPKLLNGEINTVGDELTPFYDNTENVFYFSSNGHPSIGGFDVFSSLENEELGWTKPQNVGRPINSPADDLYYVREAGKTSGFLASNRNDGELIKNRYRGDDLYYFQDFVYGLDGFLFQADNKTEAPLENAIVRLYTTDAYGNEIMVEELTNVKENYFFNLKPEKDYKVEVVKPGFSSSFEYISTKDIPFEDTLSQNLTVNKTSVAAFGSLYDDKDSLRQNKLDDALISLFEKMPDGSKRAVTTKKLGYGSTDFNFNLDNDKKYILEVVKDGYFKNTQEINTANAPDKGMDITALLNKIEVGKTYQLDNILYDFGKATLRDESKTILDNLITILQENPSIIIELAAHTDNIGSDEANLKLSQARAQSCVDYMISKGISKDRMSAKGYGESVPVAPNENEDGSDNPDGRQKNRRTEFKVLESF